MSRGEAETARIKLPLTGTLICEKPYHLTASVVDCFLVLIINSNRHAKRHTHYINVYFFKMLFVISKKQPHPNPQLPANRHFHYHRTIYAKMYCLYFLSML